MLEWQTVNIITLLKPVIVKFSIPPSHTSSYSGCKYSSMTICQLPNFLISLSYSLGFMDESFAIQKFKPLWTSATGPSTYTCQTRQHPWRWLRPTGQEWVLWCSHTSRSLLKSPKLPVILEISKVNKSEVIHNEAHSTSATSRAPSTNTTASMVGGATKRPRLDPVMPVTSLYTLWNLPSSLLLAITMGREACNWHNRVQPNVGDAISSEIGKLGRGICKRRRCRTGLELLVKATKSRFVRNDRLLTLTLLQEATVFPTSARECNYCLWQARPGLGSLSLLQVCIEWKVATRTMSELRKSIDWPSTQLWKSIGKPMSYIGTRPASRQLPHQIQVMEAARLHFNFFTFLQLYV